MDKGCIVVPYRDRAEHLAKFVPHYRDVLPIIVVEQCDDKPFNRAKLLNVGFLEGGREYDYCVMHDVDMLAEDLRGYEVFPVGIPVHMATACSQFNYMMPYPDYFGGVLSISSSCMNEVNGYSNNFWGWGAEDDHFRNRCINHLGRLAQFPNYKYECMNHERQINKVEYDNNLIRLNMGDSGQDGLTSCQYELLSIEQKDGYTLIRVNL